MRDHWDRYWSGETAGGGGCLPKGSPLEGVQRAIWKEFARGLPKAARLLDLASGDGRVMAWMIEARRDLKPIGVDRAGRLPDPPKGTRLRGGVAMEKLPFGDRSFDAVTSQFGIEYGDPGAVCSELVRVLKRGGKFELLVHHASGPIVQHNAARAEGLEWASREAGAVEKARNFVAARSIAALPTPSSFRDLVNESRARFGAGSGAEEFAFALMQTLDLSRNAPAQDVMSALSELQQAAADELARIGALQRAAADEAKIERLVALLRESGASVQPPGEVAGQAGDRPFAWQVRGARS